MQVCVRISRCMQTVVFAVLLSFPSAIGAQSVEESAVAKFYREKTISLVVGFPPGGGFDVAARIIAPVLREQIPGRPKLIVVNMPGAGTLVSANHVYNAMPQDGTVIGLISQRLILRQAVQEPAVRFDARRVQWIGSVSSGLVACVGRRDRGFSTIRDLIGGPAVPVGGTGGTTTQAPLLLNRVLGTNFKVIHGYPGTGQLKVALESGEIDGICGGWSGMLAVAQDWFQEPYRVNVLAVLGSPVPDIAVLKAAPRVEDLVKGGIERSLLDAFVGVSEAEKPFYFGPNVPRDRVQAVRAAFARTLSDRTVVKRLEKAGDVVAPRTGDEVAALFKSAVEIPPEAIAELKKIVAF